MYTHIKYRNYTNTQNYPNTVYMCMPLNTIFQWLQQTIHWKKAWFYLRGKKSAIKPQHTISGKTHPTHPIFGDVKMGGKCEKCILELKLNCCPSWNDLRTQALPLSGFTPLHGLAHPMSESTVLTQRRPRVQAAWAGLPACRSLAVCPGGSLNLFGHLEGEGPKTPTL